MDKPSHCSHAPLCMGDALLQFGLIVKVRIAKTSFTLDSGKFLSATVLRLMLSLRYARPLSACWAEAVVDSLATGPAEFVAFQV